MNGRKARRVVKVLDEAAEPIEIAASLPDDVPKPVVGTSVEPGVLMALDPFWTRGIVLPAAEEGTRTDEAQARS